MTTAQEIKEDFDRRRKDRESLELQWLLNMNFFSGNQFCKVTKRRALEELDKNFNWESREVFNHIAPIIETRLSKLARIQPVMSVRAVSGDEQDIETAKLSGKILRAVMSDLEFSKVISEANRWSEICGTGFYKVFWDNGKGEILSGASGKKQLSGDVSIISVSPFEIYPENLTTFDISKQKSIIHAKALTVNEIEQLYKIKVSGRDISIHTLTKFGELKTDDVLTNAEIVIERYILPCEKYPLGKLQTVIGDALVQDIDMPYFNGKDGKRTYPFVKQIALVQPSNFFGTSLIERLIPVQRAYNSVKNRKYEYMSRISMGVLRVEDGSVDTEILEEEGLTPGSVLVYRQGANPPSVMENFAVPADFAKEEDRLLNEFVLISGVSELMRTGRYYSENTSGAALRILSDIEDTKLLVTIDSLKYAVKETAKNVLRLYKQFANSKRLLRLSGERGAIEVFHFSKSDIGSDDVVFDTDNDYTQSLAERRNMAMELVASGLLYDENGKLNSRMRAKILNILGFGNWETAQDMADAHLTKAAYENLHTTNLMLEVIDDHRIHIDEHTKYVLAHEINGKNYRELKAIREHIDGHLAMLQNSLKEVNEESGRGI